MSKPRKPDYPEVVVTDDREMLGYIGFAIIYLADVIWEIAKYQNPRLQELEEDD